MKKKLVLVIAVILILSFVLAGCNLFTVNAERDGDQVVASVKHNGLVAEVTKSEFTNYFAQNYQQYASYFQWTPEEAGEYFIAILARQKMTVVLAVEKVCKERGIEVDKNKFNAILKDNVTKGDDKKGYDVYANYLLSLLDLDEQKYVKEQTNKMFQDSYDEYIETEVENDRIKAEEEKNNSSSSSKEDVKDPRPTKDKEEDTTFKKDNTVTKEDVDSVIDFFTANKPNDNSTQYEKDAYKNQEKALTNTYLSYDYYLAKQAESRLSSKYQDYFKASSDGVDVKVNKNYEKTLQEQINSYKTASNYKSAIEGDTTVIYHNGRYVKVKSILLQFSDEQKAALDYIKKKFEGEAFEQYVQEVRKALVFGTDVIESLQLDKYIDDLCGLVVYKSNPNYDPKKPAGDPKDQDENTKDEDMNFPYIKNPSYDKNDPDSEKWQSVPFLDVIAELGEALMSVDDSAKAEYKEKYPNANDAVGEQMYVNQKRAELFEEWIYLVNDDSGMFEGKEYTETPVGNSSDYVVEYTALVRQLLLDKGTAGSVMVDQKNAIALSGKADYANIVITKAKVGTKEVEIYTDTENEISFIINEFGVHIVMLTTVPVDMGYNQEGTHYEVIENKDFDMTEFEENEKYTQADLDLIKEQNSYYKFTMDAYVGFDEETGKAITLREKLSETLQNTYDSNAYSSHTEKVFDMYGEKLFDKKDDKDAAEGYAEFKFELVLKKSVYNGVVSAVKRAFNA